MNMKRGPKWSEMSTTKKVAACVVGAIQVGLAIAAWTDLARRPSSLVRGSKRRWALVLPINIIGPLSYFKWGRIDDAPPARSDVTVG